MKIDFFAYFSEVLAMLFFLEVFFAAILGTATAILGVHFLGKPRITFPENIRSFQSPKLGRQAYSIQVIKKGGFSLVEVAFHARLFIKYDANSVGFSSYRLYSTWNDSPAWVDRRRTVHIRLDRSKSFDNDPKNSRGVKLRKSVFCRPGFQYLHLEDIFVKYPGTYIEYYLIGHNSITGIKYIYKSKKYTIHALRNGTWTDGKLI